MSFARPLFQSSNVTGPTGPTGPAGAVAPASGSSDNNVTLTGDQSIAGQKTFIDDLRINDVINQGTIYIGSIENAASISTTGDSTDFSSAKTVRFMTHPLSPTTPIVSIDIGGLYVNTGNLHFGIGDYYIKSNTNTTTNLNLMS